MSLYLRLVIGPIVVCDIDLFATAEKRDPDKEPPAQLAGGSGTINYPDPIPVGEPVVFGFTRRRRHPLDKGYSAIPDGQPKPPPPPGRGSPSSVVVTPSRTDRQPPTSVAGAKGGETPVDPAATKHPDLVTHHEET